MGFFVNEIFEHKASGVSLEGMYVNIGSFQVTWVMIDGEKQYTVHSITHLHASKNKKPLESHAISFPVSYSDISSNVPQLIYTFLKNNKYAGHTFLDDL